MPGCPPRKCSTSLIARTANVRRIHRWRTIAAAAAVAIVALGGGAAAAKALQPSGGNAPPGQAQTTWQQTSGTGPAGRTSSCATGTRRGARRWKSTSPGWQPGSVCQFQVTDATGEKSMVGSWRAWQETAWYPASTWLGEKELRSFQVIVDGKVAASAPAD